MRSPADSWGVFGATKAAPSHRLRPGQPRQQSYPSERDGSRAELVRRGQSGGKLLHSKVRLSASTARSSTLLRVPSKIARCLPVAPNRI